MRKTTETVCPYCGSPLYFGVKNEPGGWKVQIMCDRNGCRREFSGGNIPRESVSHLDEVYRRAEGIARVFGRCSPEPKMD
jgi:hypothetical protein